MLTLSVIFLFALNQPLYAVIFSFTEYTHVSRTFEGITCLTGCSADNECYIDWNWNKSNCSSHEIAPIYLTSQHIDPSSKYCLSNCGYFGEDYEWCITTEDLKWDYCSSYENDTFFPSGKQKAKTRLGKYCTDHCRKSEDYDYYWCHFNNETNKTKWEYCAPPSLPRVPVLRDSFFIGDKNKGNCDGLLEYISSSKYCVKGTDSADNFVTDLADAIEGSTIQNDLTRVVKVADAESAIDSYTMIEIRNLSVPAVIRAHITNETLSLSDDDEVEISAEIKKKLREQLAGTDRGYEVGWLIGSQLGGPNEEFNIVPRAINGKCEEWWDMEKMVKSWCQTTGGSVDMTIVVFYETANKPIPNAFGVSLNFRNFDNSQFIGCREKIHFNYF